MCWARVINSSGVEAYMLPMIGVVWVVSWFISSLNAVMPGFGSPMALSIPVSSSMTVGFG